MFSSVFDVSGKSSTEASQDQLVEERGFTDLSVESEVEQRPRLDGSSSSDGGRWWERTEAQEEKLSVPRGERLEDNVQVSREACADREIHGVQDLHIERCEQELRAFSCLCCAAACCCAFESVRLSACVFCPRSVSVSVSACHFFFARSLACQESGVVLQRLALGSFGDGDDEHPLARKRRKV